MNCKFCSKECKNANSLRNHERCCRDNPNRNYKNGMLGKKGANHYSKMRERGETPKRSLQEIEKRKRLYTEEWRSNMGKSVKNTILRKIEEGTWHFPKSKLTYSGESFQSSWEVEYAKYLDGNNIPWERNKRGFTYFYKGKERKYIPDFYLPTIQQYIEIKGYESSLDRIKWSQFEHPLKVLKRKDLETLGII